MINYIYNKSNVLNRIRKVKSKNFFSLKYTSLVMKSTYIERGLSKVGIAFENDYKW